MAHWHEASEPPQTVIPFVLVKKITHMLSFDAMKYNNYETTTVLPLEKGFYTKRSLSLFDVVQDPRQVVSDLSVDSRRRCVSTLWVTEWDDAHQEIPGGTVYG